MSQFCPHCKSTLFKGFIKRPGVFDLSGDTMIIKKEITDDNKVDFEVVSCFKCKEKLTNEQLVSVVKCSKCGKEVEPSKLLDGICEECFFEARVDLKGLSPFELAKKILEFEKAKMDSNVPAGKETPKEEIKVEDTKQDKEEIKKDTKVEEEKPKKTRTKKENSTPPVPSAPPAPDKPKAEEVKKEVAPEVKTEEDKKPSKEEAAIETNKIIPNDELITPADFEEELW